MAFESRYPATVDRAIREGVAAKMRTKEILNALRAGTLPALNDEPIDIPDRTFHRKLKQARAKVAAGVKPKPEGPSLLVRLLTLRAETPEELRSRLEAEGTDPETIDAAVEELRQRKLAEQRDRDERERIKMLASQGLTVEQIREATGLSWRELDNRLTELRPWHYGELTKEEAAALRDLSVTADKLRGEPAPARAPGYYGPPTRK